MGLSSIDGLPGTVVVHQPGAGILDDNVVTVSLPFTFEFFGIPYSQIHIDTNGVASFTAATSNFNNQPLPTASLPNALIALFWDDLFLVGGISKVMVRAVGDAGSREFIIEWNNVQHISSAQTAYNGQIVLFEADDRIELNYGANTWQFASATIGIENHVGTVAFGGPNAVNTNAVPPTTNFVFRVDSTASDLTATVASTVTTAQTGQQIPIDFSLINGGATQSGSNWTYAVYLSFDQLITPSDVFVQRFAGPAVPAGGQVDATQSVLIPLSLLPVAYYVGVIVDDTLHEYESVETNNTAASAAQIMFSVGPKADLVAVSVSGGPTTNFTASDVLDVTHTIRNVGQADAAAPWRYRIYLSADNLISANDILLATRTPGPIAAGGSRTGIDRIVLPPQFSGPYFVGVLIDDQDVQLEIDEANNAIASATPIVYYECGDTVTNGPEVCDDGNTFDGDGCSANCLSDESCGNGIIDPLEQCDDSNHVGGDGCSADCLSDETCGNGVTDTTEACDDGGHENGDGCSADCLSDETCGNTVLDVAMGEACDDGGRIDGDGCSADCALPSCGDDITDPGETCDDGNNVGGDGCSATCMSDETCSNSIIDPGEACDDGNTFDGDGCSADCTSNEECGNATLDDGETCDDGNNVHGDGCSADCRSDETCGNSITDVGEVCDDGNNVGGDGCSADCQTDETCGNGTPDAGETCDDGNNVSGDGCSADCRSDETCGNSITDHDEMCDDGNTADGDGCSADCTSREACGDGVVETGEVCDDGNTFDGDGCSATCRSDETCGNGIVDVAAGEACDDGNTTSDDGCAADCLSHEYCGDGVMDVGEVCDDGNNADGDGCSAGCTSNESCGNGIVDVGAGEECDDGNTDPADGCSGVCRVQINFSCVGSPSACRDVTPSGGCSALAARPQSGWWLLVGFALCLRRRWRR